MYFRQRFQPSHLTKPLKSSFDSKRRSIMSRGSLPSPYPPRSPRYLPAQTALCPSQPMVFLVHKKTVRRASTSRPPWHPMAKANGLHRGPPGLGVEYQYIGSTTHDLAVNVIPRVTILVEFRFVLADRDVQLTWSHHSPMRQPQRYFTTRSTDKNTR